MEINEIITKILMFVNTHGYNLTLLIDLVL